MSFLGFQLSNLLHAVLELAAMLEPATRLTYQASKPAFRALDVESGAGCNELSQALWPCHQRRDRPGQVGCFLAAGRTYMTRSICGHDQ